MLDCRLENPIALCCLVGGISVANALITLAKKQPDAPQLAADLRKAFPADKLQDGSAVLTDRGDFLWAIASASEPYLYVDDEPVHKMNKAADGLWFHTAKVQQGYSHAHFYRIDGKVLGDKRFDNAALNEDSYEQPGVPQGKLSEMMIHESAIYPGYKISWWIYASPGVDPATPAPSMIWHDGQGFTRREAGDRLPVVTENLVHQKKIPPMVHILLSPTVNGEPGAPAPEQRSLRSLLYDSVNDHYNKMVFGEIYPKAQTMYKLRTDGYSTGTCGQSSGGICAFNQAWFRPDRVSRVISRIGTFTSIQWRYGQDNPTKFFGYEDPAGFLDGGNLYPFLLRKRDRKNIRVWLSDGNYDLENNHGSWPLQNIQMANSLKMQEYDFHFRFGNSQHSTQQGASELPEAMTWLWRDYDPSKTEQIYEMDPLEKEKPYFRVKIVNR
ncbi:MAG: esterase [Acidobacteria bacterium]|nr:esterase [Acidobacteriota bacterium]